MSEAVEGATVDDVDEPDDPLQDEDMKYPRVLVSRVRRLIDATDTTRGPLSALMGFAAVSSWQTRRGTTIDLGIGFPEPVGPILEYDVWLSEKPTSTILRVLTGWPSRVDVTLDDVVRAVVCALSADERWQPVEWSLRKGRMVAVLRRPLSERPATSA